MGTRIFVGNLSFNATEADLRTLFGQYGEVTSVKIITDQQTGKPRGFGFVEMATEEETRQAIDGLSGKAFMDRPLSVSEAIPQQRERTGGGRGFGGGGGKGQGRGRRY